MPVNAPWSLWNARKHKRGMTIHEKVWERFQTRYNEITGIMGERRGVNEKIRTAI